MNNIHEQIIELVTEAVETGIKPNVIRIHPNRYEEYLRYSFEQTRFFETYQEGDRDGNYIIRVGEYTLPPNTGS